MALLLVETESGAVEGLPANNQRISVFKGIPFAKPPIKELRWKAPKPVESWEGILKAYRYKEIAYQPRFSSEGGNTLAAQEFYVIEHPMSEDCLYLNVWTPANSHNEKMPVGIYIHGGAFETGLSYLNAYDGESFAKNGIVIVTFSYRLNVFGFLASEELKEENYNESTGNYGLMDQIAAIEWVQRNIAGFGGDPENITVFGQSAGGFSVQYLCQSPLMHGKIKRAIMQSGGGLTHGSISDPKNEKAAVAISNKYFEHIGVSSIKEARKLKAEYLIKKYESFKKECNIQHPFFPAIDGYVLTENAMDYFLNGKHPNIDYMLGCTSDEMRNKNIEAPPYGIIKENAEKRFGKKLAQEFLSVIEAENPVKVKKYYENIFGDEVLAGNLAWCENQVRLGFKPSFMYYFTYVPPGAENIGAHHSAEHHYVFQTLIRSYRPYTGFDYELSNELLGYWASFIKTGNPNSDGFSPWEPYTESNSSVLEIGKERKMIKLKEAPNVKFIKDFALGNIKL